MECLSVRGAKAEGALPVAHPPENRVQLIIYDNDGPEGLYVRLHFERSWHAIKFLMQEFKPDGLSDLNFELENFWK